MEVWLHDKSVDPKDLVLLQGWIRELRESKSKPPILVHDQLDQLLLSLQRPTVSEKKKKLLNAIGRKTSKLGMEVSLDPKTDFPLGWVADKDEFAFLLEALVRDSQLLHLTQGYNYVVTAEGWDSINSLEENHLDSDQAFIAMWFEKSFLSETYPAIKSAVERCGYQAYMVGDDRNEEKIDYRIMANIRKSRFLIADMTGQRNGVYFEAGYAKGLGIPVIWSVRHDDLENVHFDTRQFPHISWESPESLETELVTWIETLIGRKS